MDQLEKIEFNMFGVPLMGKERPWSVPGTDLHIGDRGRQKVPMMVT